MVRIPRRLTPTHSRWEREARSPFGHRFTSRWRIAGSSGRTKRGKSHGAAVPSPSYVYSEVFDLKPTSVESLELGIGHLKCVIQELREHTNQCPLANNSALLSIVWVVQTVSVVDDRVPTALRPRIGTMNLSRAGPRTAYLETLSQTLSLNFVGTTHFSDKFPMKFPTKDGLSTFGTSSI